MNSGKALRIFIVVLTIAVSAWYMNGYGKKSWTFYGDACGYYLYLPATFIYHNFTSITEIPPDKHIDERVLWYLNQMRNEALRTPKGYIIDQYTYGVAFFELPFFLIAHAYEKANGLEANGFSYTYHYLIKAGTLLYAILGLILVYRILRNYFSEWVSFFATLLILMGTNLFWFAVHQSGMSHVPLFLLYALLIYLTIQVYKQPKLWYFLCIGLVAGMITIIRPTDIICLFIPLLYQVYNKQSFREKLEFIKTHKTKIIFAALVFIVPFIPQMIYWKAVTGSYLFYSYGGQSFNWTNPRIMDGLFYGNNGWLPYSLIMIFSILGLLCYRTLKNWNWCIWLILPVYVYVIYSWHCFNYINGLGSRPMIHLYPLLALPLAAFIQFVASRKLVWKFSFAFVALFFVAINICFSMQQANGILNSEESNLRYNMQMLFRMNLRYNDLVVYDVAEFQPDSTKITKLRTLACENYEDSLSENYVKDPMYGSKYVYHFNSEEHHPNTIKVNYDEQLLKDAKWFKCSGKFMCPDWPDYFKHLLVFSIDHNNESSVWKAIKIENKIGIADGSCHHDDLKLDHFEINKWGYVYFYIPVPKGLENGDVIKLDLWNIGKRQLYMDDICLELYK